ncbi:MAG: preprotein translocase subunit SecY, partial [Calditrichaeota bacterium]
MLSSLQSVFKIQELRKRILFTLGILIVYRIGSHITLPNVNSEALLSFFTDAGGGGLFGLYDMFVGGAFSRATIFALGIMPYISASIIIQLLGAVMPYFQRLQKQGEEGRRKITQYSRYGTVAISLMQAYGVSVFIESITTNQGIAVVPNPGWGL